MSEPIQLNIYFNHQNYPLETFADESLETLSAQIESITNIQSCYQTLLIETYYLPLDLSQQLSTYRIKSGQTIVVLGSNKVAADPKQKLSEVQLEKIQESYFSKHPLGLENQLNFCYLISSVQALFSLKPVQAQISEKLNAEEPHLLKLKELFTGLQEKTNPKITAFSVPFVKKFEQFQNVKEQHDAQEALSCLETNLVQNGVENMFEVITDKETMQFLPLQIQLWEVELLFLVYYVSNYILKYFATSNADDKFQQTISSWRLFMNYSLTQDGQKYDFDRIRSQSTIQSQYLIFQKVKIEIATCNKRRARTKINAVEDVQGRPTNSLNKLRQI
ncbi:Ubiquitin_carboxyl-terminal hydrolase family protein [Hexamita inflata]|uniref:Ubiquitin_carboxyl-terminal hydrolase family protein n=1 Tax=Hexamita inflata TaxID=28002 RepID=A0ABP1GVE0_9EUKA